MLQKTNFYKRTNSQTLKMLALKSQPLETCPTWEMKSYTLWDPGLSFKWLEGSYHVGFSKKIFKSSLEDQKLVYVLIK